jgi:hypothetical protein
MGIIRRDKMKKLLILILLCSFFACQKKEPVFTLVACEGGGYFDERERGFEFHYNYYIFVENVPNDRKVLKRLMVRNFLDSTSPADSLLSYRNLEFVSCMFLKPTLGTRSRFVGRGRKSRTDTYTNRYGRNAGSWYNNKTYIGNILINRCKEDTMKLKSTMFLNLGTTNPIRWDECGGPDRDGEEIDILLNECEPDWHIKNKDNELVKLFNEYYKKDMKGER